MITVYEELGECSRRSILGELRTGPKSVTDLVVSLGMKQPNVSNHLAKMRERNVVRTEKVGRQVFYSLANSEVEAIVQNAFVSHVGSPCGAKCEDFAEAFAHAAIEGDDAACSSILDRALVNKSSMLDIYESLLGPSMYIVGTLYQTGKINEAQEHLASAITERMMARVVQVLGPTRKSSYSAVLGCAQNSMHTIGLRMLGDVLKLHGWKTLFLGANVPTTAFISTILHHQPSLVLVSCNSELALSSTLGLVREVADLKQQLGFTIGVGGATIQANLEKFKEAGADFSATSLSEFAEEYLPKIEKRADLRSKNSEPILTPA